MNPPVAMTIAGSDSGGGAGIQADLKTFAALGVFGTSAITALTAQNTRGVRGVYPVPVDFVVAQIETVLDDLPVAATKTGMLATAPILLAVAALAAAGRLPRLVVDPVMVSSSGDRLLDAEAEHAYIEQLLPHATVVTPNLREAEVLLGGASPRSPSSAPPPRPSEPSARRSSWSRAVTRSPIRRARPWTSSSMALTRMSFGRRGWKPSTITAADARSLRPPPPASRVDCPLRTLWLRRRSSYTRRSAAARRGPSAVATARLTTSVSQAERFRRLSGFAGPAVRYRPLVEIGRLSPYGVKE